MVRARAAYRLVKRTLCVLVAVGLCVASAALGDADASELIYSPWEKHCIDADLCVIGMDVRLASGCKLVVAGALLTERTGETKRTLRVGLPNYVRLDDGVRISFDQGPPLLLPLIKRHDYGSVADHEAGAELVDQLKRGTILVIEATSAAGVSLTTDCRSAGSPPLMMGQYLLQFSSRLARRPKANCRKNCRGGRRNCRSRALQKITKRNVIQTATNARVVAKA
jgi:invasion protein IalB